MREARKFKRNLSVSINLEIEEIPATVAFETRFPFPEWVLLRSPSLRLPASPAEPSGRKVAAQPVDAAAGGR